MTSETTDGAGRIRYTDVCQAETREEAVRLFDAMCEQAALLPDAPSDPERLREIQRANVGYFAGYYSAETRTRMEDWLGAEHPIFGRTRPTPEQAYEAGRHFAGGRP